MRLAVEHLVGCAGHRRIAEISGPLTTVMRGATRYPDQDGAADMAGRCEFDPSPSVAGDFEVGSGYSAAQHLLATVAFSSAVLVGNDLMALGAMRAFDEAGLRIPEDVSIGYDDAALSAYLSPPLTTVPGSLTPWGARVEHLGVSSSRIVLRQSSSERLHPELIVRQSTYQASTRRRASSEGGDARL